MNIIIIRSFWGKSRLSSSNSSVHGLAGRYATALYDLAEAENRLESIVSDLDALAAMIADSDDLLRLLRSPVISAQDQANAMAALAGKAEFDDLTSRFIGVVAANRRLFVLPDMITVFKELLAFHRGEVTAQVTSATELKATQMQALSDSLKQAVGSTVTVETVVDPDLLGGLVVRVGSRMVDSSLRTKLQQLRLAMIGIG
mgnify:CR=1 FL=1